VSLSIGSGVVFVASVLTVVIPYAVGADGAVEDTWFGALLVATAFAGLLGALAAFVLAIVAKVRHERWTLLWLPLGLLPAVIVFLVLGEAFWWE